MVFEHIFNVANENVYSYIYITIVSIHTRGILRLPKINKLSPYLRNTFIQQIRVMREYISLVRKHTFHLDFQVARRLYQKLWAY